MAVARADRKDINSLIILMARSSWIEETVRFFFFWQVCVDAKGSMQEDQG
jgi:hypothetical protein